MDYYGKQISRLIEEVAGLPGVGAKTAQRLAVQIITRPKERAQGLAQAIVDAKNNVQYCKVCQTLTDSDECPICRDTHRNH